MSPSAYQRLVGCRGEEGVSRAARTLVTNYILSSDARTLMENVIASSASGDGDVGVDEAMCCPRPWFQLYFFKGHQRTLGLICRAERSGKTARWRVRDTGGVS